MKRLILFLIRKRLGLKKYQYFQFDNQALKDEYYYFTPVAVMKYDAMAGYYTIGVQYIL